MLVNTSKQCQKWWSGGALAAGLVGGELGAGFLYLVRNDISYTYLGCFSMLGGVGGGRRAFGNASQMSMFQIRQAVPVGLSAHFCSWACWGWFFMEKKMYISRYNVFTYNIMFSKCLGRCYWMDGIGWVWMTISELGRCS